MSAEPNTPPTTRKPVVSARQRLFRVLALLLGLLGALLVAEVAMRAYLSYIFRGRLEQIARDLPTDPRQEVTLGKLIHPVPNDDIIFRLKPNARGIFRGAPVRINSLGYHDNEFQERKPPEGFRVLVLGDSNSFGWGVLLEMAYPMVLEGSLRRLLGDRARAEVINTAVPGYNAVMEVETFFAYGLRYDPDIVIIQYSLNDNILPEFLQSHRYTTRFDRLYLFDAQALSYLMTGFASELYLNVERMPFEFLPDKPLEQDPATVPERYRHHVGPEATRRAYGRLAAACRERGIPLYCLLPTEMVWEQQPEWSHDHRYDEIRDVCREFDIPLIDSFQRIRAHVLDNKLTSNDMAIYPPYDWHPNPLRHALTAREALETLLPHLQRLGLTDADIERERARLDRMAIVRLDEHLEHKRQIAARKLENPPIYDSDTTPTLSLEGATAP